MHLQNRYKQAAVVLGVLAGVVLWDSAAWSQARVMQGSERAQQGGLNRGRFPVAPESLHPLNASDAYGNNVLDRIYESLVEVNYNNLEFIPLLAKRWQVSKDKRTYTFYLNPQAKWADGKSVTAEDVKFSLDVRLHPKLKTRAKWQAYYSQIESAEVLDSRTVRFRVSRDHFRNLVNIGLMRILPRHQFDPNDPNKTKLAKQPMGSGAYRLVRHRKGQSLLLERRQDYWGWGLRQNKGRFNPKHSLVKVILNDKVALETFKKGELDTLSLTARQWVRETQDSRFGLGRQPKKSFIKLDIRNKQPRSYSYVGWNLESPLFNDRRVRQAMSHLFDRKTIIQKFFFNLRTPAVGPFEANSSYSSPKVKPLDFSIPKAIALLKAAGWKDTNNDGLLDKSGAFRFTVLTADPDDSVKILTFTQANMRKAGVEMRIKVVEWSTLTKLIDEYNYDAVMLGWSRTSWPDPTALWHSKSAVAGGLNVVRYKNPAVDKLIERSIRSIGRQERIRLYRSIHELIDKDQPYAFLVESDRQLLSFNAKLQQEKLWYNYAVGTDYWWFDRIQAK